MQVPGGEGVIPLREGNVIKPEIQERIRDPACFPWHEVKKVDHYYLSVDALTQPMKIGEQPDPHGGTAFS